MYRERLPGMGCWLSGIVCVRVVTAGQCSVQWSPDCEERVGGWHYQGHWVNTVNSVQEIHSSYNEDSQR